MLNFLYSTTERDLKQNSLIGEPRLIAWYLFKTDLSIKNDVYNKMVSGTGFEPVTQ